MQDTSQKKSVIVFYAVNVHVNSWRIFSGSQLQCAVIIPQTANSLPETTFKAKIGRGLA